MWTAKGNVLSFGDRKYKVKEASKYVDALNELSDPIYECVKLGMSEIEAKEVFRISKYKYQDLLRRSGRAPVVTRLTDEQKEKIIGWNGIYAVSKIAELLNVDRGIVVRFMRKEGLRK
jgi:hypothetical protein